MASEYLGPRTRPTMHRNNFKLQPRVSGLEPSEYIPNGWTIKKVHHQCGHHPQTRASPFALFNQNTAASRYISDHKTAVIGHLQNNGHIGSQFLDKCVLAQGGGGLRPHHVSSALYTNPPPSKLPSSAMRLNRAHL